MTTSSTFPLHTEYQIPAEERPRNEGTRESYTDLVQRLSHQSVIKHFDAYADIDWESEDYRIDPEDPRWELADDDSLGATTWYRVQPQSVRARIGLHMIAQNMKVGLQFESALKRGLLEFTERLANGAPEFRYIYHEITEEAQHALMFQEFINRTGFDVPGLSRIYLRLARLPIHYARTSPEFFFFFVLSGEDPIDHVQRIQLRSGRPLHPLVKRIMQIHITEEARHLCFARQYIRQHLSRLGRLRRHALSVRIPLVLNIMAQFMLQPSQQIIDTYAIPAEVLRTAYNDSRHHHEKTLEATDKIRRLCDELGLITPFSQRLWRLCGIWPEKSIAAL
jgi:hypothetical protein